VAERLARDGRLLASPALPEIVAVRDWTCQEVIAQLAGSPPRPWPGTAQAHFEIDDRGAGEHRPARRRPTREQLESVAEETRGVVAADEANRIVAVSRPLADALGWDPAELVGRRVVTIVPHALREAHVAAFTRHLSTGEAHILGVPLRLPALRADGTEVLCDVLLERVAAGTDGAALFLGWIEPVAG
jgi:PAS domain S-box-containing protein